MNIDVSYENQKEKVTILDFYCWLYFRRFRITPVRIGNTDRFVVGSAEKSLDELKKVIWENIHTSKNRKVQIVRELNFKL